MKNWLKNNWIWIFAIITFLIGLYLVPVGRGIAYIFAMASIALTMIYINKISK